MPTRRPDRRFEPTQERLVVCQPAHKCLKEMGVGVDQSGDHHFAARVNRGCRLPLKSRGRIVGAHCGDAVALHENVTAWNRRACVAIARQNESIMDEE